MSTPPFTEAGNIPVNDAQAVVTYGPLVLKMPDPPVDLQVKVSAPESGSDLPIILMSHGHGTANCVGAGRR